MPQEHPRRSIPYTVPGYRPFEIPAGDSARFARLLELAATDARPDTYDRVAYRAFQTQYGIPTSPGMRARYHPIMQEEYLLDSQENPQEPPPRRTAWGAVEFGAGTQQAGSLSDRIRAARATRDTVPAPVEDEPGFFARALGRLRDTGGEGVSVGKDLVTGAFEAGVTRPAPTEGKEEWNPELRSLFEHFVARPGVQPPPEADVTSPYKRSWEAGLNARHASGLQALEEDERRRELLGFPGRTDDEKLRYVIDYTVEKEAPRAVLPPEDVPTGNRYEQWLGENRQQAVKPVVGAAKPPTEWNITALPDFDTQDVGTPAWDQSVGQYIGEWPADRYKNVMSAAHSIKSGYARVGAFGAKALGLHQVQAELAHLADLANDAAREYHPTDAPTIQQLAEGKYPGSTARGIVEWVSNTGTEGVVQMLPVLLSGLAGKAMGMGQGGISSMMFASSYAQNYGENYQNLVEVGVPDSEAMDLAALYTIPVAGLDMFGARGVGGELLTPQGKAMMMRDLARSVAESRLRHAARGAGRGFVAEFPTEGAQELIGGLAQMLHGETPPDKTELGWRVLEAAAAGGLVGGTMGGGASAISKPGMAEWDAAQFRTRNIGFHPDPARAAEGEMFERRRGYAQQTAPYPTPTIEFARRASDRPVQAARGANLVPAETQPRPEGVERRRSAHEVQDIFLSLARDNPKAVVNDLSFLNIEGGFPDGVPPEAVPGLEARLTELETKRGLEDAGAVYRRGELVQGALTEEEEAEAEAISWLLQNVMPIARLRREGEIDDTKVEDRIKVAQAREGRLEETPERPVEPPSTPEERPEPVGAPSVPGAPVSASRDAKAYTPPAPGESLPADLIPEYVADVEDVQRRDDVFQFRTTGPRSRAMGIPDEVPWSPAAAARTAMWAWKDTEGELGVKDAIYIVDGHNRLRKAQQSGIGRVNVKFLNDLGHSTAQEARVAAALNNIALDPNPSPELLFDAVTVMRESGLTKEQLEADVGARPGSLFSDAASIASLPQGVYDNYRDQSKRSFKDDVVYVALGEHGLSDAEVLSLWEWLTHGKRPTMRGPHSGYIVPPGGTTNVRNKISRMVDYARKGVPETEGLGDLFSSSGVAVPDAARWSGDVIEAIDKRIRDVLDLGKVFGRKGAAGQERGLIEGYKPEAAEELAEDAKAALGRWDLVQRDPAMRDKINAWGQRLKKASTKDKKAILDEAWNEISKAVFATDAGIEGEGAGPVSDDATGRRVEEPATAYPAPAASETEVTEAADEAPEYVEKPPELFTKKWVEKWRGWSDLAKEEGTRLWKERYGPTEVGAPMGQDGEYGPYEILWSAANERWNIHDKRTGDTHPENPPQGFRKARAARRAAGEYALAGTSRQVIPPQERMIPPEPVTEPVEDAGDGRQPQTEPGPEPEPVTEPVAGPEPGEVVVEEPEIIEAEEVTEEDYTAEGWDETFGVWEGKDAPGKVPTQTSRHRLMIRDFVSRWEEADRKAKEAGITVPQPKNFHLHLLLRNIGRFHAIAQNMAKTSRDRVSEVSRRMPEIRAMLIDMFPDRADIIEDAWAEATAFPREYLIAAHMELLDSEGAQTANDEFAMNQKLAHELGYDFRPAAELREPKSVRWGQKIDMGYVKGGRVLVGKFKQSITQIERHLKDHLFNPNGKWKTRLIGNKQEAYFAYLSKLAEDIETFVPFLSWQEVNQLIDLFGERNPVHKIVSDYNQRNHKHSAWYKVQTAPTDEGGKGVRFTHSWQGPWDNESHPYVKIRNLLTARRGDLQRMYNWLQNPEFGQAQTLIEDRDFQLAEKRRRNREAQRGDIPPKSRLEGGQRFVKPQRDMFNPEQETVQGELDELMAERGLGQPPGVRGTELVEEANRRRVEEALAYAEDMYDEWWEARLEGEDPLTLSQKEKLLEGMKYATVQSGLTYRNPNDVHALDLEVQNQRTERYEQLERPDNGALDFERNRSLEAGTVRLSDAVEQMDPELRASVEEARAELGISRRVLNDVGIYDESPQKMEESEARRAGRKGKRLKTNQQAMDDLERILKVTMRTGKHRFTRGVLGVFKVRPRAIRIKYGQDIEAAAHEIGHALQFLLFGEMAYTPKGNLSNAVLNPWAHELIPLAQGISTQDNIEGLAEFVRRWFNNPAAAQKAAPDFYEFFNSTMQSRWPIQFKGMLEVREDLETFRNAGPEARFLANLDYPGREPLLVPRHLKPYRWLVDAMHPIDKFAAEAQGRPSYAGGIFRRGRESDVSVWRDVELLARDLNGVNGLAEHWIRRGQLQMVVRMDPATGKPVLNALGEPMVDHIVVGLGLEQILAGVRDDIRGFSLYGLAKRVIERYHAPMLRATKKAQERNLREGTSRYSAQHVPGSPGTIGTWDSDRNKFVSKEKYIHTAFEYKDAQDIIAKVDADPVKKQAFEHTFSQIQEYRKNQLRYLVANGSITQATYQRILAGSTNYIPMRPAPENVREGVMASTARPRGPHVGSYRAGYVPPGVYRMEGAGRPIMDPLEALYRDTYEIMAIAHRSRLANAIHQLVEERGNGYLVERVMTPIEIDPLPLHRALDEIKKLVQEETYDALVADIKDADAANNLLWAFREGDYFHEQGMISFVDANGKRRWYEVKDKDLFESMMALEGQSNLFLRILFPPWTAKMLRVGSTTTPTFSVFRNPSRDILMGDIQSRHGLWSIGPFPGPDHIRAIFHLWRGERGKADEWYDRFIRGMGSFGALVDFDRASIQREIDKTSSAMFGKGSIRTKGRPVNIRGREFKIPMGYVARDAYEQLTLLSAMMENMTRMAEFMRAYNTYSERYGSAEAELMAGYDARDVTTDFRRHGSATLAVRQGAAFWNANIQGWDKTIRTFKEDMRGAFLRSVINVTIPTMLLWAINSDDDDYRELPQWVRDYFWLIPLPVGAETLPEWLRDDYDPNMFVEAGSPVIGRGRRAWIKIPKPFGLGTIFGTLPERALDMAVHEDTEGMAETLKDTIVRELVGFLPLPTFWTPLVENYMNHSIFFDRPVVPRAFEDVEGRYQHVPTTTEFSKAIGGKLSWVPGGMLDSPLKIDNVLYSWFGTMLRDGLRVTDAVADAAGFTDPETAGTIRFQRIPFARDIFQSNTQWTGTSVSRVYEQFEDAKKRDGTERHLQNLAEGGKPENVDQFVRYLQGPVVDNLTRDEMLAIAVGFFRFTDQQRERIVNAANLSDAQKNSYIFRLRDARELMAQRALKHNRAMP